jgi:hypothetical protein
MNPVQKLKIFQIKIKEDVCVADKINARFVSVNHSDKKTACL